MSRQESTDRSPNWEEVWKKDCMTLLYSNELVQCCRKSIANALMLLLSCTKSSLCYISDICCNMSYRPYWKPSYYEIKYVTHGSNQYDIDYVCIYIYFFFQMFENFGERGSAQWSPPSWWASLLAAQAPLATPASSPRSPTPPPPHSPLELPADDSFRVDQDYEVPEDPPALELEEGALPATADVPPDQTTVTYTVVASGSQRGKPKLFDSLGYDYVVNKVDFMWLFIITACRWPLCPCRVVKPHGTPSLATVHFSNISLATIGLP